MDHLTSVAAYPFINARKVSIREFIDSWPTLLKEEIEFAANAPAITNAQNAADLNIPLKMVRSLNRDLNPDRFCRTAQNERLLAAGATSTTATCPSETLREVLKHNERFHTESNYRMSYRPKYRHDLIDQPITIIGDHGDVEKSADKSKNKKDGGKKVKNSAASTSSTSSSSSSEAIQAILTVQIFRPAALRQSFRPSASTSASTSTSSPPSLHHNRKKLQLDREIEILSSQSLDVLRDSFVCVADILPPDEDDYSDRPLEPLPSFCGHTKPGFFFIDRTFYDDERCESMGAPKRIAQWAEERQIGGTQSQRFEVRTMQSTRFEQLTVQLGYPYLYMHANDCEHLLVFTDIRLYIPGVDDAAARYPKCTAMQSIAKVKCQMCSMFFAKWLVFDNRRLPESPFHFCHSCFLSFNYDADQRKIGSFEAYPCLFNLNR